MEDLVVAAWVLVTLLVVAATWKAVTHQSISI